MWRVCFILCVGGGRGGLCVIPKQRTTDLMPPIKKQFLYILGLPVNFVQTPFSHKIYNGFQNVTEHKYEVIWEAECNSRINPPCK